MDYGWLIWMALKHMKDAQSYLKKEMQINISVKYSFLPTTIGKNPEV